LGVSWCTVRCLASQVVLLATSIMSTATVLKHLPVAMLSGRLVVDVLSVKEFPKTLLMKSLPPDVNILCTHPMFGPDSEKQNIAEGLKPWQNLNFQYEKVRVIVAPCSLIEAPCSPLASDRQQCWCPRRLNNQVMV
jgi:arogenate dehydrogenase (NADP+)